VKKLNVTIERQPDFAIMSLRPNRGRSATNNVARLWQAEQKDFVFLAHWCSGEKSNPFPLGVSLIHLPSGNCHGSGASSGKGFYFMERFVKSEKFGDIYVEDSYGARQFYSVPLGYATHPTHGYHFQREWYIGSGLLQGGEAAFIVPLSGLTQMSDQDIISVIRGAAVLGEVAELEKEILDNDGTPHMLEASECLTLENLRRYKWDEYHTLARLARRSRIIADAYAKVRPHWEGTNPEAGFIYLLSDQQGHVKIGRTSQLTTRIKQLSTQPPFRLTLICAFRVIDAAFYEHDMHRQFADKRMNGEWFRLTPEDVELILTRDAGNEFITEDTLADLESPSGRRLLTGGDYNY
jgi:predicted outer membrane lipoprotein